MNLLKSNCYKYIAVYVVAFAMTLCDSQAFTSILAKTDESKLKVSDPIQYYIDMHFYCDEDGTWHFGAFKYIEKMMESYEWMFETNLWLYSNVSQCDYQIPYRLSQTV